MALQSVTMEPDAISSIFDTPLRHIVAAIITIPFNAPLHLLQLRMTFYAPSCNVGEKDIKALCLDENWPILYDYMVRREGRVVGMHLRKVQLSVAFRILASGEPRWDMPHEWQRMMLTAFETVGFEARMV